MALHCGTNLLHGCSFADLLQQCRERLQNTSRVTHLPSVF